MRIIFALYDEVKTGKGFNKICLVAVNFRNPHRLRRLTIPMQSSPRLKVLTINSNYLTFLDSEKVITAITNKNFNLKNL